MNRYSLSLSFIGYMIWTVPQFWIPVVGIVGICAVGCAGGLIQVWLEERNK